MTAPQYNDLGVLKGEDIVVVMRRGERRRRTIGIGRRDAAAGGGGLGGSSEGRVWAGAKWWGRTMQFITQQVFLLEWILAQEVGDSGCKQHCTIKNRAMML